MLSINCFPVVFCPLSFVFSLQVSGVVTAEYELEHLLLEGHCFDLSTGQPPRGLQFTLGMSQDPLMYDTIVMANLVSGLLHLSYQVFLHRLHICHSS